MSYLAACEMTGLQELSVRRQARCLQFAKRSLGNPITRTMFPENKISEHNFRSTEKYVVNFASTENYKNSTLPFCQRLLNKDTLEWPKKKKDLKAKRKGEPGGKVIK